MKTVQDYLDLGLAFVDDDKLRSSTNNKDDKEVCMSGLCIAHQRYCDGFRGGNAIFFYPSEWAPSSFAWRNNDGVKPEYKGLIHAMFENGDIIQDFAKSLNWGGSFNSIIQWRPVVSMCNHTELKPRISFVSAISIDSPKFTVKEEKPKTTTTVNIEGRDYILVSHKPAASPKEDESMKPVYTAEMHARNELPPVDSKVKVCIEEAGFELEGNDTKHEGKVVTVKAAFINKGGEKIVAIESDKGSCACYIIKCIKPIIKTIKVNGFDVPAPMSEAPEIGDEYFTPQTGYAVFYCANKWICDGYDRRFLSRGLVHATESAAIAHAKAMLGIDPNA